MPLVLWTDAARERGFACLPIFCEEPGCACRVVRLLAVSVEEGFEALAVRGGGRIAIDYQDGTRQQLRPDTRHVRATVDLDSGEIAVDPQAKAASRSPAMLKELQALVDDTVLDGLRTRLQAFEEERRRDRELVSKEGWPDRDWTDWDGQDVDWQEVRPDQPPDLYDLNGETYAAHEIYCADLDCTCEEVEVVYVTPEQDALVGQVTIHGPSGLVVATRSEVGKHPLLMRLWDAFAGRRDLPELEARRQRVLTIAPRISEIQERQLGDRDRARRQAGRNDPCPCGSGKKYKRCCL